MGDNDKNQKLRDQVEKSRRTIERADRAMGKKGKK